MSWRCALALLVFVGAGCDKPAAGPRHHVERITITAADGSEMTKRSQPGGPGLSAGETRFGAPGKAAWLRWRFVQREGNTDRYEFTRTCPLGEGEQTRTFTANFAGQPLVVFQDQEQTVTLAGCDDPATTPRHRIGQIILTAAGGGRMTSPGQASGEARFGMEGKVARLQWQFIRREGPGDRYKFTRTYPLGGDEKTAIFYASFVGEPLVVFQDAEQTVRFEPASGL